MSFRHADAIKKYVNNARLGKVELEKTIVKKRFWGKNMLGNGPAGHGAGQWFWAGETAHMASHCSRMQCTLALYTLALYLRSCDVSSQRNKVCVHQL